MRRGGVNALFRPQSIAVIGATPRPLALGERVIRYLLRHGYKGKLYPVNPRYQHISGLPCFPSLSEVPGPVDLALVALSAERVLTALVDCAQKRVKAVTLFAAGFAESGPEGKELQNRIKEIVLESGLRICGPNGMGTINVREGIAASFSNVAEMERFIPGSVGVVAQSGGMASSIFDRAQEKGLGISFWVSSGNEVDLEAADYIDFMLDDLDTKVIMAFIEGFKNGPKFTAVADRALKLGKPLVVLKVGASEIGKKAAASHTGSLAGSDSVCDAVFKQRGIIRVDDIDELLETAHFLASGHIPEGDKIGIVAPSGGASVLITDKCEQQGLRIPEISAQTGERLRTVMPPFGSISNPLDPTGQGFVDPGLLVRCIEVFVQDEGFDVVVIHVPNLPGDFAADYAEGVVHAANLCSRPLAALYTGGALPRAALRVFRDNGIPSFLSFNSCFRAIGAGVRYCQNRREYLLRGDDSTSPTAVPRLATEVGDLLKSDAGALTEHASKLLLSAYSIPCTREGLAQSAEDAVAIANRIGYPVAMKVQSAHILHKTDAQVIRLGLADEVEVARSFTELEDRARKWNPKACIAGILVQEMVHQGVEAIAGISYDLQFGPVVLFGLGGIFVEVLRDVSMRVAPLSKRDAENMITEIKGFPLLDGARGRAKGDLDAVADVLLKLSQLAVECQGRISQVDINPLMILKEGEGVKAVDALVLLSDTHLRSKGISSSLNDR